MLKRRRKSTNLWCEKSQMSEDLNPTFGHIHPPVSFKIHCSVELSPLNSVTISYLTRHDSSSARDNSLLTWTMDIPFDLQHGLRLHVWTQPELTGWEEGGYSFILFLSFIQVNVLQPEFPFHPNPKARDRQATWLYLGNTLEVLIMTFEQRGHSFQYTEFREIQTTHVILMQY